MHDGVLFRLFITKRYTRRVRENRWRKNDQICHSVSQGVEILSSSPGLVTSSSTQSNTGLLTLMEGPRLSLSCFVNQDRLRLDKCNIMFLPF